MRIDGELKFNFKHQTDFLAHVVVCFQPPIGYGGWKPLLRLLKNEKIPMFKKIAMLLIVASIASLATVANAEEKAGQKWPADQWVSINEIKHDTFDQLLKKYVDQDGRVNYKAWHQSSADRNQLKSYLSTMSRANPDQQATREARLAYWINAYNAVTIEGILRVYPTTSIRNHTAKLVGYNIWKNLIFTAGNKRVSLEDIEHKILRKMDEPRIHFAIVCASIGCPRLLNEAYTPARLEQQLVTNTKDFFGRQQNLRVGGGVLYLSQLISWFGSDFGRTQQQQMQMLGPYFPPEAQALLGRGGYKIKFLDYDWDLNTQ